jgi:type IV pilus assembly protein PilO
MRDLAQIKNRFLTLLGVLGAINLVLLAYLLWPGTSSASRRAKEESLQQQYRSLTREVAPLKDIDQKLVQTRGDINELYQDRIPNRWSVISSELEKLMKESGVTPAQSIHYGTADKQQEKGDLPDVQRVNIDTSITGQYTNVARFINAMEQDKLLFIIRQISLSGQEGGTVTLQIKVETYLRSAQT